jgi:site-specific DNA recombinase
MRVACYTRVSTDRQAEKYGIPSQVEALKKRCQEKDWTPVIDGDRDAFIDDGYSGAELDRPALNRLRQAVREGRVDIVLVYDPDRLSRKLFHQMILAEEFEKQGIKLEFITQDMGTSPEDRMFFNMRGLIAEYEREKIRERTIRGSREKARQGKLVSAGAIPFGFSYSKEKATLEEDPESAQIVKLIFYTFANENLSLQKLADRLNRLRIPTPRGGNRWRASTLGIMLRNEVYIGKMYQFRQYRIEPKLRHKPLNKSMKTSTALRPKEEWMLVEVPSLISPEIFEAVQRKLRTNLEWSRRNTKRQYLLSGLLYCSRCGGRMGGHAIHGITYYRCYRTGHRDGVPLGPDGESRPCTCPEVKGDTIETEVWNTICQLVRDPDFLVNELNRRNNDNSQTKEILERELQLCRVRLKAIPEERMRLVEGYRKGLYADFMMRQEMEYIQSEEDALEKRKNELERQFAQRQLTQNQELQLRTLIEKISTGLNNLDFNGKQELLRLLVDKVLHNGQSIEIQTIIPLRDQLHPICRRGQKGIGLSNIYLP